MNDKTQPQENRILRRRLVLRGAVGAILASPLAVFVVRRLVQQRDPQPTVAWKVPDPMRLSNALPDDAKPVTVVFAGPFSPRKYINKAADPDALIDVPWVSFEESTDRDLLRVMYRPRPAHEVVFQVHRLVTATDRNHVTHVLDDSVSYAPCTVVMEGGMTAGASDCFILPVKASEIVELKLQYMPKESSW